VLFAVEEEVDSSEEGSSGKVSLCFYSAFRRRGRYRQGGLRVLAIKEGSRSWHTQGMPSKACAVKACTIKSSAVNASSGSCHQGGCGFLKQVKDEPTSRLVQIQFMAVVAGARSCNPESHGQVRSRFVTCLAGRSGRSVGRVAVRVGSGLPGFGRCSKL
jgi:hypothetical protein